MINKSGYDARKIQKYFSLIIVMASLTQCISDCVSKCFNIINTIRTPERFSIFNILHIYTLRNKIPKYLNT